MERDFPCLALRINCVINRKWNPWSSGGASMLRALDRLLFLVTRAHRSSKRRKEKAEVKTLQERSNQGIRYSVSLYFTVSYKFTRTPPSPFRP